MHKCTCLYLLLITVLTHGQSLAAEPRYDFRVVIDVSGSMKQTGPQNLRVPALKLINGLIPTGSRAGVWTFGRYVNMAVKWGKVDISSDPANNAKSRAGYLANRRSARSRQSPDGGHRFKIASRWVARRHHRNWSQTGC